VKHVQIAGMGCPKCKVTHSQALRAAAELGIEIRLEKVESAQAIADLGVLSTPAVLIDGTQVSGGRVPSVREFKQWFDAK
jgi:small redox-active disulfide protein 2